MLFRIAGSGFKLEKLGILSTFDFKVDSIFAGSSIFKSVCLVSNVGKEEEGRYCLWTSEGGAAEASIIEQ